MLIISLFDFKFYLFLLFDFFLLGLYLPPIVRRRLVELIDTYLGKERNSLDLLCFFLRRVSPLEGATPIVKRPDIPFGRQLRLRTVLARVAACNFAAAL